MIGLGHRSRFRENDDLPLWQGPAIKKKRLRARSNRLRVASKSKCRRVRNTCSERVSISVCIDKFRCEERREYN